MSSQPSTPAPLDLRALEERTQAIGHALFTTAKREARHLSMMNHWTAQVLSWCLSDSALKRAMLRFIDVLPSLRSSREVARHVREYFPPDFHVPAALRVGAQLARPGLLTHGALALMIRQLVEQVARQFIAEHRPEGAARVIRELASRGATCSLDMLGEQVLSETEADRYVAHCEALLHESVAVYAPDPGAPIRVQASPRVNLSVKPSALTPHFDPLSPAQSIARAAQRLHPLLELADDHDATINLDMEHYDLHDLTLELAKHLLVNQSPREGRGRLGLVIQAYLRDAEAVVEELLTWLAVHEQTVTIRLVKGAYWDAELAQAQFHHWPIPVFQEKAETDGAFERLTRRLLGASPLVMTAVASHNVRSIAHAMAVAEALGLAKEQLEFQLLYGMGDAIHAALVALGYPVRIYTPIGDLIPGMAYLVRRILENTANESFLRQDFFQERSVDELLKAPQPSHGDSVPIREPVVGAEESAGWAVEPFLDFSRAAHRHRIAEALTRVHGQLGKSYPLLLGDGAVRTSETLVAHNPANPAELIGSVSSASLAHVDRAVQCAAAAQREWAKQPVRERVACLQRSATLIRAQRAELTAWEILEVGKTWREADADVVEAIEYLEYYSHCMMELAAGKPLPQRPGEHNLYTYRPRGVTVVIAPWNFPAAILTGMAAAALVTGNAVILKPAEQSSLIAAHLSRMLREAGIPPAVLQYLPGGGEDIGAALVRHPETQVVLFTGSKAVGLSIVDACAKVQPGQRFIKHAVVEMGGKNAILIDADADLDAAINGTLRSAFGYGGQKCSAASRVIVHEAVYDRLLSRLIAAVDRLVVGDPADPDSDLGPLIDAAATQRLEAAMTRAHEVGTVAYRYPASRLPPHGFFVTPAIVTELPWHDALATEELFGPLLCLFRVRTFEEALTLANDTAYALTGGVYSRSPSHLQWAVDHFDVGNLYLNRPITGALVGRQPFGGHRLSGLGTKAGGPDYLLQLLMPKTICVNTTRYGIPLD